MNFSPCLLFTAAALAAAPVASAQFSVRGNGGSVPATVTSGNRCDTLPIDRGVFPATTAVPADANRITSVDLQIGSFFLGDVHAVLRAPNGVGYNLVVRTAPLGSPCGSSGSNAGLSGSYTILPNCDDPTFEFDVEAAAASFPDNIPNGFYASFFGDWIDGSDGVFNRDLSSIEAIPGIWQLEVYDGNILNSTFVGEWRMNGTTGSAGGTVGGPGGVIPSPAPGDLGDNCSVLPGAAIFSDATAPIPGGGSISSVTLTGLNHTWAGDLQIMLRDPNGERYHICAPISNSTNCNSGGDSSNFGGDYTFVPAGGGGDILAEALSQPSGGVLASGTYDQYFGIWVDGSEGVFNVDLASIPVVAGIWSLQIWDGFNEDFGDFASWSFTTTDELGTTTCVGVPNSTGVGSVLVASGNVCAAANDLTLDVSSLPPGSVGFFVTAPNRGFVPNPGGSTGNLCIMGPGTGRYSNTIQSSGSTGAVSQVFDLTMVPSTAGLMSVSAGDARSWQYWHRDSDGAGAATSNFSSAVEITFQ